MKYPTPSEQDRWQEMGKDCFKICEAKAIFGPKSQVTARFDWIFVEHNLNERYSPSQFLYALPNPLPRNSEGAPYNPIIFRAKASIAELFGIDFDSDSSPQILCGEFCDDLMVGKLTFAVATDFVQTLVAPHVLVRTSWGIGKHRGKEAGYAKTLGAVHFDSAANNSGKRGVDYWILPWSIAKAAAATVNQFKLNLATECFPEAANTIIVRDTRPVLNKTNGRKKQLVS